jgi:signal transduction histidine kinase
VFSSIVTGRDLKIAVGAVALDTLLFTGEPTGGWSTFGPPSMTVVLLNLAMIPALLLRRRYPVPICLVLCGYAAILTLTVGSRPLAALLVALFTAAALRPAKYSGWCLAAILATHAINVYYQATHPAAAGNPWTTALVLGIALLVFDLGAWFLGRWAAESRRRADERVKTGEEKATKAVAAERLRIARELHDIVAHSVTVMVLQTSGARRQLVRDPGAADAALASVEAVGKQAMAEMRRLLHVLRTVGTTDEDALESGMIAGLKDLDVLVEQSTAAGVTVDLSTTGLEDGLHSSVELSVYRVVQEALTNVVRHAGPGAHVNVVLTHADDTVTVEVANDGSGTVSSVAQGLTSGYGLAGLQERIKLMGGEISTGPREDGGYRVYVTLPAVPP